MAENVDCRLFCIICKIEMTESRKTFYLTLWQLSLVLWQLSLFLWQLSNCYTTYIITLPIIGYNVALSLISWYIHWYHNKWHDKTLSFSLVSSQLWTISLHSLSHSDKTLSLELQSTIFLMTAQRFSSGLRSELLPGSWILMILFSPKVKVISEYEKEWRKVVQTLLRNLARNI